MAKRKVIDSDTYSAISKKIRERIYKKYKLRKENSIIDYLPLMILALLIVSLYSFQGFDLTDITGASFTSVSTCGFTTNQSNTTLNLSANLSIGVSNPCIDIIHDNVTVECNGFSIIGSGAADTARGIRASTNTPRIQNCVIINFGSGRGIQIRNGSNSSVIRNVTLEGNQFGIELWSSSSVDLFNHTVTGSTFRNNEFGIRFLSTSTGVNVNSTVNNSTFIRNNVSILIQDALTGNITVSNNTFNHSNESGVRVDNNAHNNTITMNNFDTDGPTVATIDGTGSVAFNNGSDDSLVLTNNFSNSERTGGDFGVRIQNGSSNLTVNNNYFFNQTIAIKVENGGGVTNITIFGNTFNKIGGNVIDFEEFKESQIDNNSFINPGLFNHSTFISITSGNHSFITNNSMTNVRARANGIAITALNNTTIANNIMTGVTVTTGLVGIRLANFGTTSVASGNNISSNIINVNFSTGIRLIDQNLTLVENNEIYNVTKEAIAVDRSTVASGNITVRNNTIIEAPAGILIGARTMFNTIINNFINQTRVGINVSGAISSLLSYPFANVVDSNNITDANFSAISLVATNATLVTNNVITSPTKPHTVYVDNPTRYFAGIFEFESLNNSIQGNSINFTYHGIYSDQTNNTSLIANLLGDQSGTGISLVSSNFFNASGNNQQGSNGTGLFLYDSNLSIFDRNSFRLNVNDGAHLIKSFSNNLTNTTAVSNNNGVQIDFFSGFNQVLNCTTFAANTNADLLLDFFTTNTTSDCAAFTVISEDGTANNTII